ncbi:TRAP transporter small permease subunit [Chloroflexota bacterium]
MKKTIEVIDSIINWVGRTARWACVALILVLLYEVTARYAFNAPTNWAYETSMMLGCTIAALGWAYTHLHNGHVRIDVFYDRLSPRRKAISDVIGALLFFFPLLFILVYAATEMVQFSWSINEKWIESNWYPPALPIRILVLLGLLLFVVQGAAQFVRDLYQMIRNKPL